MKRIKVLAIGLLLSIAGVVYAAGGNSQTTAPEGCEMNKAEAGCCGSGSSCCTGGSCCAAKSAKQ